ncbi:hypothetical protein WJX81_005096 [Elliptochloris bilobata]|uniref:Ribosomal silencing factor RsfS n=1 Tax=Elliptochloris bilobata TaxID=381761 RepID=A0AAW1SJX6_9CHLO
MLPQLAALDLDQDEVEEDNLGWDEGEPELPGPDDPDGAEEGPDQSRELAVAMARVASDTKATDVLVLHVAPLVYWTSYLVLVTVTSRPQLQAILGKMERQARDEWGRAPSAVAPGRSVWEVLDYGDIVIHLFTAEQREYYDLESFYGAAEEVELPFATEAGEASWTRQY